MANISITINNLPCLHCAFNPEWISRTIWTTHLDCEYYELYKRFILKDEIK
jgi:hypothetical protein